jgi:hypothetical protein
MIGVIDIKTTSRRESGIFYCCHKLVTRRKLEVGSGVLVPASRWFQKLHILLRMYFGVVEVLSAHQAASAAGVNGKVV